MDPLVTALTLKRSFLPAMPLSSFAPVSTITKLDVSGACLGPMPFNALMLVVSKHPTLTSLDASSNFAANDSCGSVAMLLSTNPRLLKLELANNPFTTTASKTFGEAMKVNRTLKHLGIASCGLVDSGDLFDGLKGHPALSSLVISNNQCGKTSWTKLSASMASGLKLTSLQARGVEMGDGGITALADGIRMAGSMQDIEISGAGVTSRGLGDLLDALKACKQIRRIACADCKLGGMSDASVACAKAIAENGTLCEIDLSGSLVEEASGVALVSAFCCCKALQKLEMSGNEWGEGGGAGVKAALGRLRKLGGRPLELGFGKNDLSKLFYEDVMADDWEEPPEGESPDAWIPPKLILSDTKPSIELLEELGSKVTADDTPLRHLVMSGVPLGKPPGTGRLPRGAPPPPPLISKVLNGSGSSLALTAVHLHNASLKDAGASFLADLIKSGWKVTDLDLGFNEISDSGCTALAEACQVKGNSLARLQLRINRVRNDGAKALGDCMFGEECKLEWVSLASNVVGTKGLKALMEGAAQSKTLKYLDCSQQKEAVWSEDDFRAGAKKLSASLSSGGNRGLMIDISGIEGMSSASEAIDCGSIETDYSRMQRCPFISIQDFFHMLSGFGSCITALELDGIFGGTSGAGAGAPSWLRDEGMRRRGVFISQLQLSITKDRLEDFLESEADANVLEIVMCVDR